MRATPCARCLELQACTLSCMSRLRQWSLPAARRRKREHDDGVRHPRLGVAVFAVTGLMGATGAQTEKTLEGASSFNTNDCRCRQCEFNPLISTHTLAFEVDCRRKALSGFGRFVTALGRRAASLYSETSDWRGDFSARVDDRKWPRAASSEPNPTAVRRRDRRVGQRQLSARRANGSPATSSPPRPSALRPHYWQLQFAPGMGRSARHCCAWRHDALR